MQTYEAVMTPIGSLSLCTAFLVRFDLPVINALLFSLGAAFLGIVIFMRTGIFQRTLETVETAAQHLNPELKHRRQKNEPVAVNEET